MGDKHEKVSLFFVLAVLVLLLSSCVQPYTPVAYTRFVESGTQKVYYSTDEYGSLAGHIEVYADEEAYNAQYSTPDIEFHFGRILGPDTLDDGYRYTTVDLSGKNVWMTVYLANGAYSESKSFYLNDNALTPDRKDVGATLVTLEFDDVDLIQTNPNGHINESLVNVLEYK